MAVLRAWLVAASFALVVAWCGGLRAEERPDYRSLFFHEVLTPQATEWTHRFDAYQPTSYTVDKLELVEQLPAFARVRGQELLGVLVIGPVGFLWSYQVVTFVREGTGVRVVTTIFPHARITGKATRRISRADYERLAELLFDVPGLTRAADTGAVAGALARRAVERGTNLEPEWLANLVFASFTHQRLAFGEVEEDGFDELESALDPLLQRLTSTYEHGQRPPGHPRRRARSFALMLSADVAEEPLAQLNRALAARGFGAFDRNTFSVGLGMDYLVSPGWRLGYDMSVGSRSARHRTLDARARFGDLRITPRLGVEVFQTSGLSLFYSAGLRWQVPGLTIDKEALPGMPKRDLVLSRTMVQAELGVTLEYYLPRSLFSGFVLGSRSGFVGTVVESDFEENSFLGNPSTESRGVFTQLYFGWCAGG